MSGILGFGVFMIYDVGVVGRLGCRPFVNPNMFKCVGGATQFEWVWAFTIQQVHKDHEEVY